MTPFRRALEATMEKAEIERLIESIPKIGMRLNLRPDEVSVVLRAPLAAEQAIAE